MGKGKERKGKGKERKENENENEKEKTEKRCSPLRIMAQEPPANPKKGANGGQISVLMLLIFNKI